MADYSEIGAEASKWTPRIIMAVVVAVVVLIIASVWWNINQIAAVDSYEECVAKGYPVLEAHPSQCRTPDGRLFTEDLKNKRP